MAESFELFSDVVDLSVSFALTRVFTQLLSTHRSPRWCKIPEQIVMLQLVVKITLILTTQSLNIFNRRCIKGALISIFRQLQLQLIVCLMTVTKKKYKEKLRFFNKILEKRQIIKLAGIVHIWTNDVFDLWSLTFEDFWLLKIKDQLSPLSLKLIEVLKSLKPWKYNICVITFRPNHLNLP